MIVTIESEYMLNRPKSTGIISAIILDTIRRDSTSTLSGALQKVAFLVNNFVFICFLPLPGSGNVFNTWQKIYIYY